MKKTILIILAISLFVLSGCQSYEQEYLNATQTNVNLQNQVDTLKLEIEQTNNFFHNYQLAKTEYTYAYIDSDTADYNYDLFSIYYDDYYFYDAIEMCKAAREVYSTSNSEYNKAVSYFKKARSYSEGSDYTEIIDKYIDVSTKAIEINWAMYETCEYFESASYEYARENWVAGDSELEKGNAKINKHDRLVPAYNEVVADLKVLEESI